MLGCCPKCRKISFLRLRPIFTDEQRIADHLHQSSKLIGWCTNKIFQVSHNQWFELLRKRCRCMLVKIYLFELRLNDWFVCSLFTVLPSVPLLEIQFGFMPLHFLVWWKFKHKKVSRIHSVIDLYIQTLHVRNDLISFVMINLFPVFENHQIVKMLEH